MPESLCEVAPEGKLRQSFKGLSFLQALMISLNYNLGFSVLLFPYMIASAGWVGYAILIGACFVTLTTARFIATLMVEFPCIHTYSDLGKMAARVQFHGSRRAENIVVGAFRVFQSMELFMYLLCSVVAVPEALLLLSPHNVPSMASAVATGCAYVRYAWRHDPLDPLGARAVRGGHAGRRHTRRPTTCAC